MSSVLLPPVALLALALAGCKESSGMLGYVFGLAAILAGALAIMRVAVNASRDRPR